MKTHTQNTKGQFESIHWLVVRLLIGLVAGACGMAHLQAQTSAFTYEGRLHVNEQPATGDYDLAFRLFDGSGSQFGLTQSMSPVAVSNGYFQVTLDFGQEVWTGDERFLDIAVRPVGNTDLHVPLEPRHPITSAPYAVRATTASSYSGPVSASQLTGTLSPAHIAPETITTEMMARGSVDNAALAPGAVYRLDSPNGSRQGVLSLDNQGNLTVENPVTLLDQDNTGLTNVGSPQSLVVHGDYAYVAQGNILIFRVADPANLQPAGEAQAGSAFETRFLAVENGMLYGLESLEAAPNVHSWYLQVYDLVDPANPSPRDRLTTNIQDPSAITVKDGMVYVTDDGANLLRLFSVHDPNHIVARDTEGRYLNRPSGIAVADGRAYVVDSGSGRVEIFDVSNPNLVSHLKSLSQGLTKPFELDIQDNRLLVADAGSSGLIAQSPAQLLSFELSGFPSIPLRASYSLGTWLHPVATALRGQEAFVLTRSALGSRGLLRVFDHTSPHSMIPRSSQSMAFQNPMALAVQGNTAFVLDGGPNGLTAFDLAASQVRIEGVLHADLASGSVTSEDLEAGAVTTVGIEDGTITGLDLAPDLITSDKIKDATITAEDLAPNSVNHSELVSGAVRSDVILNGSIEEEDLASGSITSSKIRDHSINREDLRDNVVNSSKIANYSIANVDLAANVVTSDKIASNTITRYDLAPNSVTESELATGSVRSEEIQDGTITESDLNLTTQTFHYQIPASQFVYDGTVAQLYGGYWRIWTGPYTHMTMDAPVQLPQGARIEELRVYYYDNAPAPADISGLDLTLWRRKVTEADSIKLASIFDHSTSGASTSVNSASDNSITGNVVDNNTYQYFLTMRMFISTIHPDLRFYGASIRYTMDKIAP